MPEGRRSCPHPRTRGAHAVCPWFVTVCTSVCVSGRGVFFFSLIYCVRPSSVLCRPLCSSVRRTGRKFSLAILLFLAVRRERGRERGRGRDTEKRTKAVNRLGRRAASDSMPCVCVAGPQEEATLGSAGWSSPEELLEQASQAQQLERLAQLCIMSKQ